MSEMFVAIKTETEIIGAIECTPKVKGCEMNHVTSRMIEKASCDTTPFNRSNTKTVKMANDEVMNKKKKGIDNGK